MDLKDSFDLVIDASENAIKHSKDFFSYLREPYSNAENVLIKALNEKGHVDSNDIEIAAANLMVKKWVKKIKNHNSIIDKVNLQFEQVLASASSKEGRVNLRRPDEDWLEYFFDLSSRISNEAVQQIWANILLKEHLNPGEISKVMLNTLALLDSNSANCFYKLCQLSYKLLIGDELRNIPLIIYENDIKKDLLRNENISTMFDEYLEFCPNENELELLSEIGLVTLSPHSREYYIYYPEDGNATFSCNNFSKTIKGNFDHEDNVYMVQTGYIFFSQVGLALYNIIGGREYDNLDKILNLFINSQNSESE